MSVKPKSVYLQDKDALYFYNTSIRNCELSIKNRNDITSIANKYNIKIVWKNSGETCNRFTYPCDEIHIYGESKFRNKRFFTHLRNAFAHCYIEISDDRCKLLDWNAYEDNGKTEFRVSKISMIGDVDYSKLKQVIEDFFSDKNILKK